MISVHNKQSVSLREWEDERGRPAARAAHIDKRELKMKEALREEKPAVLKERQAKKRGRRRWWEGRVGVAWSRGGEPGQPRPGKLAGINRLGGRVGVSQSVTTRA